MEFINWQSHSLLFNRGKQHCKGNVAIDVTRGLWLDLDHILAKIMRI